MPPKFEFEELVVSLATISEIIFKRLQCMECNQCEPCGPVFMGALRQITEAGENLRGAGAAGEA
jgi:hypothetical protein